MIAALEPVSAADAAFLAEIHALGFPPHEAWSETVIALQITAPGGFGFVYGRSGMVLGRIITDEAEILTIMVVPRERGHGIGRALLNRAIEHATEAGARYMFLEVSVSNIAAQTLYRSCDFLPVSRRRRYYADGTDALVMRLDIAPSEPSD